MHSDPRLGTFLAGYRLESVLGRGGMGVVYLAEDTRLGRNVAVKVLAPEHAAEDRFRERFLRESRLAASIDHPNILPVFEAGRDGDVVFLVMRYVASGDLRDLLLREGRLEVRRALHLLGQVGSALDAAHGRGLVHRDVKPGNILVAQDAARESDHAYLADFGLTRDSRAESELTDPSRIIGTLDYLAPEQIRGDTVDGNADQYALGCLIYQALSGVAPFAGTDVAVLWAHVHDPPPSLQQHRPDLASALDPVIDRAMAKDPAQRFPTCAAMFAAATAALDRESQSTRRPHRRRMLASVVAASLIIGGAVAAAILASSNGHTAAVRVIPNSVAVVDPGTSTVVADIPVGSTPGDVIAGAGYVWVTNSANLTVSRIDPRTLSTAGPAFSVGAVPEGLAAGAGRLWVGDARHDGVIAVDAQTETPAPPIPIRPGSSRAPPPDGGVSNVVLRGDNLYAEAAIGVARIDTSRGDVVRLRQSGIYAGNPYGPPLSKAVAVGEKGVWVETYNGISRLDPHTLARVATLPGPNPPSGIAAGEGWVWVADAGENSLWRIDPRYNATNQTYKLPGTPTGVAVGGGWVWASEADGTVTRMDPEGGRRGIIHVGATPTSIAYADGLLWVSVS